MSSYIVTLVIKGYPFGTEKLSTVCKTSDELAIFMRHLDTEKWEIIDLKIVPTIHSGDKTHFFKIDHSLEHGKTS